LKDAVNAARNGREALVNSIQDTSLTAQHGDADYVPYDKRKLSYATTFPNPWKAIAIRVMEWLTGKFWLLRLIRKFEQAGVQDGQGFWSQALDLMGVSIRTPKEQIVRIPKTGPVVIVANHPHGLVDGMVMAELIGRVRQDYRILTRSLLTEVDEVRQFMIAVPFPYEEDALAKNLEMRKKAMKHLSDGGVIVLFPSGVVASSDTMFGPAIEREWNPFTAKMVHRSDAVVVPIHFLGQNSRWYQIANQVSATLRQGLLIHEVVHALNKPQAPVIGHAIGREEIAKWQDNPRGFVGWLRETTLALKD
jgi:putative hemolysin